jgi:hypothetical protein
MFDYSKSHREHLETMRRERALLIEQIRQSKETIAESQDLLRRFDEVLQIETPARADAYRRESRRRRTP